MKRIFATCVVAFVTTVVASAASASSGTPTVPPTAIDDSQLHGLVAPRGLGARYTFMGSLDQLAGLTGPPPLCG